MAAKLGVRLLALAVVTATLASCGHAAGSARATVAPTSTVPTISGMHVPTVTSQPLRLPAIRAAEETACLTDSQTIRMAEYYYSIVNGRFASLRELVDQKFLRTASSYYIDIRVGVPAGGYTLVPAPIGPCPHLPVGASQ